VETVPAEENIDEVTTQMSEENVASISKCSPQPVTIDDLVEIKDKDENTKDEIQPELTETHSVETIDDFDEIKDKDENTKDEIQPELTETHSVETETSVSADLETLDEDLKLSEEKMDIADSTATVDKTSEPTMQATEDVIDMEVVEVKSPKPAEVIDVQSDAPTHKDEENITSVLTINDKPDTSEAVPAKSNIDPEQTPSENPEFTKPVSVVEKVPNSEPMCIDAQEGLAIIEHLLAKKNEDEQNRAEKMDVDEPNDTDNTKKTDEKIIDISDDNALVEIIDEDPLSLSSIEASLRGKFHHIIHFFFLFSCFAVYSRKSYGS
jgi:hypothetical protein